MILEPIIILVVLFFIAVLFYKQGNEQFEILQLEAERISELPTLYADKAPIVVSDFKLPALGTQEELQKRPHILQMSVAPNLSLKALLGSEASLKAYTFKKPTAEFLAKETGLAIWFEHHLYTTLLPSPYTQWLYTSKTSLWPHHCGLFKTTAVQTLIMPTQGTLHVSLLLQKALPYLPKRWEGRAFHSLTPQDTPLLNQIQFIEIKLRPGNLLLLPPHLIVDINTAPDSSVSGWSFIAEIHHPISRLA
jgi:hypothetical protein